VGGRLARLRQSQTGMPVATVHNGVAVDNFQAPLRDLSQPILVYTGAVTFWSGLETVIQALPAIVCALPTVRLRIAGEGLAGYRRELEALVATLNLGDRVEFLGRVENARIPVILADAHLGVATFRPLDLRRYAFPLKLLEYMAAGLPSIGTEDTETADLLAKHDCGVSVPFTAEAFAAAAIALLSDPARYRRMAQNARAAVEAGHRWRDLMDREYALIHETWMRKEAK
ncbi:MAG: glycosyltransferase, partial [Acidobacteriota bacterium]|nr:glycosyltransferase [Acidobacteriota bacterium]